MLKKHIVMPSIKFKTVALVYNKPNTKRQYQTVYVYIRLKDVDKVLLILGKESLLSYL